MVNQPNKTQEKPRHCVYDGPALAVPPGERIRSKNFGHFNDPVIPRAYWYLTAGLTVTALVLGVIVGVLFRS